MEEFLIGQHPVATYLVACALGMFAIWCLKQWSERGQRDTRLADSEYLWRRPGSPTMGERRAASVLKTAVKKKRRK